MAAIIRQPLDAGDLRAIVAGEPAVTDGNFEHREVGDDGIERAWRVSLAVGLGWRSKAADYGKLFGKAPDWISRCYPNTRTLMLGLAMEKGRPLPDLAPE